MVQPASPALHSVWAGKGDVLSFLRPADFIAGAVHQLDKILLIRACLHGFADVVHQLELPALALLRRPVLTGGHFSAAPFIRRKNVEAMGLTDGVTERPELPERVGILPQLLARFKADRVDDKVGMDVLGIAMGTDLNLMPRPGLSRKFLCDLVGLQGCNFFLG